MMNLTPFGVGLALAIVLPASSSAQEPEKAVVEPAPAIQRARPTATPTVAPTLAPSAAVPAKGTIQAQPSVLKAGDDDDDDLQAPVPAQVQPGLVGQAPGQSQIPAPDQPSAMPTKP